MKILSMLYYYILTKIRTFHNNLNYYKHRLINRKIYKYLQSLNNNIQHINNNILNKNSIIISNNNLLYICKKQCCKKNNGGICNCNMEIETINHYVFNWVYYNNQRTELFYQIVYIFNTYNIPINAKNILFPPPNITNQHRKQILESLCIYIIGTKRFHHYL